MTPPFLAAEYPLRFAHRGSRVLWPENTAEAFQGAIDLGYVYLETDVRMTRDGVVVIFHDETLQRTTNGVGRVADWRWEDLRRLDAAWWFDADAGFPRRGTGVRIRSLDEVLTTWPGAHFNIDLKGRGMEWAVADLVKRHHREDSTLIGSFVGHRTAKFRRITRGAVATSAGPEATMAMWLASRLGRHVSPPAVAYQLPFDSRVLRIDRRLVDAVHAAGAQVHVWTVNDAVAMTHMLDLGVDGIVSDRPDTLNDVLRARGDLA
jgi:glycerophosphoryl diester phosphodiesterase